MLLMFYRCVPEAACPSGGVYPVLPETDSNTDPESASSAAESRCAPFGVGLSFSSIPWYRSQFSAVLSGCFIMYNLFI